jgi:flagellar motility protein MotE (MotC chaperone)
VFFSLAGNFNSSAPEMASVQEGGESGGVFNLTALPGLNAAQAQDAGAGTETGAASELPPPDMGSLPSHTGASDTAPSAQNDTMLRDSLSRRQADLDRREAELNRLEQSINEKLLNVQAMEARIQTMLKEAQSLRDEKMRHLVDVYTNMRAQQAAQVLETLDERTAVQILAGMRGRQAGEILTHVKAEKAARLSEMLTRIQLPFQ